MSSLERLPRKAWPASHMRQRTGQPCMTERINTHFWSMDWPGWKDSANSMSRPFPVLATKTVASPSFPVDSITRSMRQKPSQEHGGAQTLTHCYAGMPKIVCIRVSRQAKPHSLEGAPFPAQALLPGPGQEIQAGLPAVHGHFKEGLVALA